VISSPSQLRVLAVEPYYGGSHKAFIDGFIRHSRHSIELFHLPARKWKWRMRASAVNLAQWLRDTGKTFDALFASDFLSMADFAGLCPRRAARMRKVAYFHENQFTYPEQIEEKRDYQFLFTNLTTCLAADSVCFNSHYHRNTMLREAELFLKRMPDFVPEGVPDEIAAKSRVIHVGVDLDECDGVATRERSGPLVILWNHRWEHDKNPEEFFEVLFDLAESGCDFRVMVLGQSYRRHPPVFDAARERLADRIVRFGHIRGRRQYLAALKQADVVVSTARHEFFGIAVVEAVACGCYPLLPDRLSYPEIIPARLHGRHLYCSRRDLRQRLARLAAEPSAARSACLRPAMERFSWRVVAPQLDDALEGC